MKELLNILGSGFSLNKIRLFNKSEKLYMEWDCICKEKRVSVLFFNVSRLHISDLSYPMQICYIEAICNIEKGWDPDSNYFFHDFEDDQIRFYCQSFYVEEIKDMYSVNSCKITIIHKEDQEEYTKTLNNIIDFAHQEIAAIRNGEISNWNLKQLELIILPEMQELLQYMLNGDLFLKYGKQQRLLESTYLLTDALNDITNTPLGVQIIKLQEKINAE